MNKYEEEIKEEEIWRSKIKYYQYKIEIKKKIMIIIMS